MRTKLNGWRRNVGRKTIKKTVWNELNRRVHYEEKNTIHVRGSNEVLSCQITK